MTQERLTYHRSAAALAESRSKAARALARRRMVRRALAGALVGAAVPYGFGAWLHGPFPGGSTEVWLIFAGFMVFCGLIGAGVATKNFGRGGSLPEDNDIGWNWRKQDLLDYLSKSGSYASRRN